jgi:methionine-rich copper-binding protein CopC
VATDPADGAVLSRAPAAIELTLSAAPDPAASHVSVRDASGAPVDSGPPTAAGGRRLVQPVAVTGDGDYVVAYHVTFAYAGEVTGVVRFSVDTGRAPAGAVMGTDAAAHNHGPDPFSAALLLADVLVLGAVVLLLLRRPPPPLDDLDGGGTSHPGTVPERAA